MAASPPPPPLFYSNSLVSFFFSILLLGTHTHTQSIDLSPKVYSCSWPCCRSSSSSFQPLVNVYLLARVCVFFSLFFFFSFPLVYFSHPRHKKDELRLSISVPIPTTTTVFASPPPRSRSPGERAWALLVDNWPDGKIDTRSVGNVTRCALCVCLCVTCIKQRSKKQELT